MHDAIADAITDYLNDTRHSDRCWIVAFDMTSDPLVARKIWANVEFMTDSDRKRPSPMLKAFFNAPRWLYRHRMGWLMGKRFLALSHVGRKSGIERQSVLEVAVYNPDTQESIVASAFGPKADWYRNIQARPAHLIQVGNVEYVPHQRFLEPEEARAAAEDFCRKHRLEARMAIPMFVAMGGAEKGEFSDPVDLMASLPMVAFRPAQPSED